jgi:thioredoxin
VRGLVFASAVGLLSNCGKGEPKSDLTHFPAVEFSEKLKQTPDAQVIDVRTPEEYAKGHLQDSKNMNWNGGDFRSQTATLDKTKPVFVYCLSGGRSAAAAAQMRTDGFGKVYELDGGILKWRAANLPEASQNAKQAEGMTEAQFDALVQSDKPVLVNFYADWCAPCIKMKPYMEEIATSMSDKLTVVRINADENQRICKKLKIDGLPVLLIYQSGKITWTHSGFISKEDLLKQLK